MTHVVFITGLGCDDRLFAHQCSGLKQQQISHEVVIPSDGNTISEMAEALWGGLRDNPLVLLGLSLGGIVALEMQRQRPSAVSGMVLMDTTAAGETAEKTQQRNKQQRLLRTHGLSWFVDAELLPNYFSHLKRPGKLSPLVHAMAENVGVETIDLQIEALKHRTSHMERLSQIQIPVCVMVGSNDRLCAPDHHVRIAEKIPHSQFFNFSGAGHLSSIESSYLVTEKLQNWLSKLLQNQPKTAPY